MLRLDGIGPLYQQLARTLRESIRKKIHPRASQMPGSRLLAVELNVSRNVVIAAYEQLIAEGYLHTRPKSGTFVSDSLPDDMLFSDTEDTQRASPSILKARLSNSGRRAVAAARSGNIQSKVRQAVKIDFEYGVARLDKYAQEELTRLHTLTLRQELFDYSSAAGDIELRKQLVKHLQKHRAVETKAENILITAGSQQALDICARLFLDPGDYVVIEEPSYPGARQVFEAAGAKLISAIVDTEGLDPSTLNKRAEQARLIYVTPSHQYPTGVVMPVGRRLELLKWAAQTNTYVIEDDYDSEFRYDCKPLESIAGLNKASQVIYMGTFAKSLFPSLRLGFMVLPDNMLEPFGHLKWLMDRGCPTLYQRVLALFMQSGGYDRHLRRMSKLYSSRRRCLINSLESQFGKDVFVSGANAGTHLVIKFNSLRRNRLTKYVDQCRKHGVGIYSVAPYYFSSSESGGLLMGFSGVSEKEISQGVKIMAKVKHELFDN